MKKKKKKKKTEKFTASKFQIYYKERKTKKNNFCCNRDGRTMIHQGEPSGSH